MIPDKVGPYRIERKIGSGGMGTVYLGQHVDTNQEVAVKVLPASLAREDGFVLRFTREIEAMRKLSSPHVVEVFDSGVDDDETYYYAMEYVDGVTLSKWIRENGRMPWKDVIEYSVQICSALKAAHDAGIVHRDLKPSNLLITKQNKIKLLDFGVAQVFASSKLTKTGGIIGTAEYMSSEQAQGKRTTKKSDIYSLGAVMYAMLTGRPPYSGKTSMEVIQKHKFGQFDAPRSYVPEIPHWLDEVVCKCLDKDPDNRYPDAHVLSLRLKEIIKKVELSLQDATSADGPVAGTDETVFAGEHQQEVGGTLMRDLVRAEIDRSHQKPAVAQAMDNIWVLIGLLILTIGGGFWWYNTRSSVSDQTVAISAEDEVARLKKDFGLNKVSSLRIQKMSDTHRFLHLARSYYKMGDTVAAEKTLLNLSVMIQGQPEHQVLNTAIQEILTELKTENISPKQNQADNDSLAKSSLEQAKNYLEEKKKEQAISILLSLLRLYDGDSQAQNEVENAKEILDALNISYQ
ncbi:MAG: serine/threonine protein kinase [Planctomycetaceae bacterium]|nr:serine/threonine protein kinase [Planctomycetaceae bacterium]